MARMTTTPNGDQGGQKANGSASLSFGAPAPSGNAPPRKPPLPHIDDITSVTVNYDLHTPMEKLLVIAEDLLRQAETYRTFGGRIDMAMMSYIKATILLVDVIKKHKGWVSLQRDNKAQKQRYNDLLRQADAAHGVFEKIKAEIKADNARSGIQPKAHGLRPGGGAPTNVERAGFTVPKEHRVSQGGGVSSDGVPPTMSSQSPAKAKPSVRPKPEALHGHAIQPGGVAAKRAAEDLSTRFAKLRSPSSASHQPGVQDPRIRTQPIVLPPQPDRRDPPGKTGRSSLSIDDNSVELPRMPGAIYKPARGTISTEAAELPSSSSRRYSLAISQTSGPVNTYTAKPKLAGYNPGEEPKDWAKRTKLSIPEGETISVTELLRLMNEGSKSVSILLIDIRSREAFDEGHIMSQATICIEPEVLLRKDISASDIAESMVLAPSAEQISFERRHSFDLIVFYDQNSTHIGTKEDSTGEKAVQGLFNALTYFDFAGETNPKPPKLLKGGLDEWKSEMGANSLATSESSVGRSLKSPMSMPPLSPPARRMSYVPMPIQDPDEARRWEESTNDPRSFATSVDELLRKFPSVSDIKESMVSTPYGIRTGDGSYSLSPPHNVPTAPQRPRAAVARLSYGGLKEKDEAESVKVSERTRSEGKKKRRTFVGLRNPRNWCYANSSLQTLFGTSSFAEELYTGMWEQTYRVPMKAGEKIPNPQLLAKMLSQLFAWMDKAVIDPMEARTLMQYMKHIHGRDENGRKRLDALTFGGLEQQDAQEFFSFITQQLHDETNIHRDQKEDVEQAEDNDPRKILHNAIRYWHVYSSKHDSIVTKYWRGLNANLSTCPKCPHRTITYQASDITTCSLLPELTLQASLENDAKGAFVDGFFCPNCKDQGRGNVQRRKSTLLCRLPDRLTFQINRFTNIYDKQAREMVPIKNQNRLQFPIRDLDMGPYFVPPEERYIPENDEAAVSTAKSDNHFRSPFKYDCYAVICHKGPTIQRGHYIAYVRDQSSDDPTDWIKFDDTTVTRVKVGSGPNDETEKLYKHLNQQAYMVFYQRKGV